jgi:hypothetical protein
MAIIQSGVGAPNLWVIDGPSNAGRVTLYDSNGNELAGVGVLYSLNNVLDALNENVTLILSGQANTSIQLISTTGTLTATFEANIDGYNWFTVQAIPLNGGMSVNSASFDGVWFVDSSGLNQIRVIITSYTSGSTIVSMIADPQPRDFATVNVAGTITAVGTNADNSANVTNKIPTLSAVATNSAPSWTGGNLVPLSVDTSGNLRVLNAKASSSNITSVNATTSSTVILASNPNRITASIFNNSNKTMYLALAATATTSLYSIQIASGAYYELPAVYTGIISAVWASGANSAALITELGA